MEQPDPSLVEIVEATSHASDYSKRLADIAMEARALGYSLVRTELVNGLIEQGEISKNDIVE